MRNRRLNHEISQIWDPELGADWERIGPAAGPQGTPRRLPGDPQETPRSPQQPPGAPRRAQDASEALSRPPGSLQRDHAYIPLSFESETADSSPLATRMLTRL